MSIGQILRSGIRGINADVHSLLSEILPHRPVQTEVVPLPPPEGPCCGNSIPPTLDADNSECAGASFTIWGGVSFPALRLFSLMDFQFLLSIWKGLFSRKEISSLSIICFTIFFHSLPFISWLSLFLGAVFFPNILPAEYFNLIQ